MKGEDPRLRKLSAICMKLPELERRLSSDHADFRVRGKVFVYFLNNHHGDRIITVLQGSPAPRTTGYLFRSAAYGRPPQ